MTVTLHVVDQFMEFGDRLTCPAFLPKPGFRCRRAACPACRCAHAGYGVAVAAPHPGRQPFTVRYTAYSEVVPQMNRRLSLLPPKVTLATISGIRSLPISVPSGS